MASSDEVRKQLRTNIMVLAKLKARSLLFNRGADCTKYTYDVFNRRIKEVEDVDGAGSGSSAVETRFSYDHDKVWADLDNSNNLKVRYLRDDIGGLFARVKSNGDAAWYYADVWGSTRQMVDNTGALKDAIEYDSFGNVQSETDGAFGDRWKWKNYETNAITKLVGTTFDASTGTFNNELYYFPDDEPLFHTRSVALLNSHVDSSITTKLVASFYHDLASTSDDKPENQAALDLAAAATARINALKLLPIPVDVIKVIQDISGTIKNPTIIGIIRLGKDIKKALESKEVIFEQSSYEDPNRGNVLITVIVDTKKRKYTVIFSGETYKDGKAKKFKFSYDGDYSYKGYAPQGLPILDGWGNVIWGKPVGPDWHK